MKTRQRFRLAENTQHKDVISIIAVGALLLMLGGLAACGQHGQQGQGDQQQDQSSQMQGQTGQMQYQASTQNQQQQGQQKSTQSMR